MRIFDRYIARQVLTATLAAVLVLSVVMVLGNIFRHLLSLPAEILRDMPPMLIARFIGYALVASLPFTVPWSLLTALLLVFGRLSADNELLAIRMGGNSFLRICLPAFAFALALSSLCFWINLHIAPLAQSEIVRLPTRMATANPQALLTADRIIDQIDDFVIYIGDKKDDGRLTEFQMIMLNEQRQSTGYINSRKVIVTENPEEHGLDLQLNDSLVVLRDEFRSNDLESGPRNVLRIHPPIFVGQFEKTVTLRRLYEKLERMKPGMLPTRSLGEKIESKMAEARAAAGESKNRRHSRPGQLLAEASELRTEFNKRFSFSLACLVFAGIGIPLGVTAQRRETSVGFALSLVVGMTYLAILLLGDNVLKDNPRAFPWIIVWLPNIIFVTLGGWLFWRLQRR
jgi:lipopolysaccharide export system permease protein